MKKIIGILVTTVIVMIALYVAFIYNITYSNGIRSGELIKFSNKGFLVKTWEGEISQGISGAQIFSFSVQDNKEEVIQKLQEYQGRYVKLNYVERYGTFFWLGDTKYFIVDVKEESSPHFRNRTISSDE
jgi:uncharacterized protein YxeA